jgi:type IV pilus assembly protein PilE
MRSSFFAEGRDRTGVSGFSLMELLITVAIVGILSAVAYPTYISNIQKSRRADAQSVMMEVQQYLQRYYMSHSNYTDANLANAGLSVSPKNGTAIYNIVLNAEAQSYTIEAQLVNEASDPCGTLSLTDTGAMGQEHLTVNQCWR